MKDINLRFKELRKKCGKTQTEMGKVLGLSVSGVSDIENGRRNVTEQHLIMLSNWKENLVNINWLRSGEGEMFIEHSESYINPLYELSKSLSLLTQNDWAIILDLICNLAKRNEVNSY